MIKLFVLVCSLLALQGCSTFNSEKATQTLLEKENLSLSHLDFAEEAVLSVSIQGAKSAPFQLGLIALSNEKLYFYSDSNSGDTHEKRFVMPLVDFKQVGIKKYFRGRQVQLLSDQILVVFMITDGEIRSPERTEMAYRALLSKGIPAFLPNDFVTEDVGGYFAVPIFLPPM